MRKILCIVLAFVICSFTIFPSVNAEETKDLQTQQKELQEQINEATGQLEEVQDELTKAAPFLRTKLAETIDIRHTPALKFIFDESIEYGANIEKILKDIKTR